MQLFLTLSHLMQLIQTPHPYCQSHPMQLILTSLLPVTPQCSYSWHSHTPCSSSWHPTPTASHTQCSSSWHPCCQSHPILTSLLPVTPQCSYSWHSHTLCSSSWHPCCQSHPMSHPMQLAHPDTPTACHIPVYSALKPCCHKKVHGGGTHYRVPGEIKRSRDLRGGRWSWTLNYAQKRSWVGRWRWAEQVGSLLLRVVQVVRQQWCNGHGLSDSVQHSCWKSNCAVHKSLGNGEGTPP